MMKCLPCLWIVLVFSGSSFGYWDDLTPGVESQEATERFQNFDYSVKFELKMNNYVNQQLVWDRHMVESGHIVDVPEYISPGKYEVMTGHKAWFSATGCAGVIRWNIGVGTNKMLVVMYDVPYDHSWYENTLAVGIFPRGDIEGFYNKMYYDAENGFKRATFGQSSGLLCYSVDADYYIEAMMDETHESSIWVSVYPKSAANLAIEDQAEENEFSAIMTEKLADCSE